MWRLLASLVGTKELRQLMVIFSVSAIIQGVALAMMIPFLQQLLRNGSQITMWLVILIVLGVVSFATETYGVIRSYSISVYDVCDTLIEKIADHTLQLPLGWFDAKREAQIASAMSREINTLSHLASIIIPALIKQFVTPAVIVVAVLFIDWRLALIMILCVPLLRWGWLLMRKVAVQANDEEASAAAITAGRLIEFARLQPILRANGVTKRGWNLLEKSLATEDHATRKTMQVKGRPAFLYSTIVEIAFALVIVLGLAFTLHMTLDPVSYIVIAVISTRVVQPLSMSVLYGTEIHAADTALKKVVEILSAEPLAEPTPETAVTTIESTTISVKNVDFGYTENRRVLRNINFTAPQGTMTALIGRCVSSAVRTIFQQSATLIAKGTSIATCFPCCIA